jgi:hypothetical protein
MIKRIRLSDRGNPSPHHAVVVKFPRLQRRLPEAQTRDVVAFTILILTLHGAFLFSIRVIVATRRRL